MRDELSARTNIIWNKDIEALVIKEDELTKLHESFRVPSPETVLKTMAVKRMKTEIQLPNKQKMVVARPATTDMPLKPVNLDLVGNAGVRYNTFGEVIPYSILGSYDDYYNEAIRHGDQLNLPPPEKNVPQMFPTTDVTASESVVTNTKHLNEYNALKRWEEQMVQRKLTIDYLKKMTNKPACKLIMSSTDGYRHKQELRHLIDRAIPLVENGKGYRNYSEFWNLPDWIADEETGIYTTLTASEQGIAPPFEQLGQSKLAKREKSTECDYFNNDWWDSEYLAERIDKLQKYIEIMQPYCPNFTELEVIGSSKPYTKVMVNPNICTENQVDKENDLRPNILDTQFHDSLSAYPDVHASDITGPSIKFAGQSARWTGSSSEFRGQTAIEARVGFEVLAGNRVVSKLTVSNDGTTSIRYSWNKIDKENPFNIQHEKIQRFYFNTSDGLILPGEEVRFPFIFKPSTGGMYTEQWIFITAPVVCGGANLLVTLRGVSVEEDTTYQQRMDLEATLHKRQKIRIVNDIVEELLFGIRTPPRIQSPIDAYITTEQIFQRKNPTLYPNPSAIAELHSLFGDLCPDEDWDYSVDQIKQACLSMAIEESENQQDILHRLNELIIRMSFQSFAPTPEKRHIYCCQVLREAFDEMSTQAMLLRSGTHTQGKEQEETSEEEKKLETVQKKDLTLKKSFSKEGKIKLFKGEKLDGKSSRLSRLPKTPIRTAANQVRAESRRSLSPNDSPVSPAEKIIDDVINPHITKKLSKKVYIQWYKILYDSVGEIADILQEFSNQEVVASPLVNL